MQSRFTIETNLPAYHQSEQQAPRTPDGKSSNNIPTTPTQCQHYEAQSGTPTFENTTSTSFTSTTHIDNLGAIKTYYFNPDDATLDQINSNLMRLRKNSNFNVRMFTFEELCTTQIDPKEFPSAETIKNNRYDEYDDWEYALINNEVVKLFRFIISKEKGFVGGYNSPFEGEAHDKLAQIDGCIQLPLEASGILGINADGKLVYISNFTGHYRIPDTSLEEVLLPYLFLIADPNCQHIDLEKLTKHSWQKGIDNDTSLNSVTTTKRDFSRQYIKAFRRHFPKSDFSRSLEQKAAPTTTVSIDFNSVTDMNWSDDDSKNNSQSSSLFNTAMPVLKRSSSDISLFTDKIECHGFQSYPWGSSIAIEGHDKKRPRSNPASFFGGKSSYNVVSPEASSSNDDINSPSITELHRTVTA